MACDPILINSHIGRDYFSDADNARLIERSIELAAEAEITLCHETHREGRRIRLLIPLNG